MPAPVPEGPRLWEEMDLNTNREFPSWLSGLRTPHGVCEDAGLIPGLPPWVKDPAFAVSCGIGHRCVSDPVLPWLWHRPAAAALLQPLAWELPYTAGVALKEKKKKRSHYINMQSLKVYEILKVAK